MCLIPSGLFSSELTRKMFQIRNLANVHLNQAQKFGSAEAEMSEEELGEDSVLLESPLDKLDPYTAFRSSLMSKSLPSIPLFWFHG